MQQTSVVLQQALVTYVMSLETDELNLCCYLEVVHIYLNCLQRGKTTSCNKFVEQYTATEDWGDLSLFLLQLLKIHCSSFYKISDSLLTGCALSHMYYCLLFINCSFLPRALPNCVGASFQYEIDLWLSGVKS